jgi:hypothetical protein
MPEAAEPCHSLAMGRRSGAAWQTSSGEGEAHPRNRDVLGVLCEEFRLEGVCDGADDHRPAGAIQKVTCLLVRGDDRRLPARCRWRGRKDLEPLIMAQGGEGQTMQVYACASLLAFLPSRLTASNGITPAISSERRGHFSQFSTNFQSSVKFASSTSSRPGRA